MAADIEVKGYRELIKKLDALDAKASQKIISSILSRSTTPLQSAWRAQAPDRRGSRRQTTYKRRSVAPAFLKTSGKSKQIKRGLKKAVALVIAGVGDEAFYGPQFLDEGATVSGRRPRGKGKVRKAVRSYRLPAYRWYFSTYKSSLPKMERKIAAEMEREIGRI